jgi:hypothetical protein
MIEPFPGIKHLTLDCFFARAIIGGENALRLFIKGFNHDWPGFAESFQGEDIWPKNKHPFQK